MVLFAGVDAGSVTAKAIIVEDGQIKAYHMTPAGSNYRVAAQNAMDEALAKAGLSLKDIANIVATGYGANTVDFANQQVTDISGKGS